MTQNRSYGTLCFLFLFTLFWKYFLLSKRNFPIFGIFIFFIRDFFFNAVILQSLSHVWFFVAPWSNSCPLSQWCYLTISSSAVPFSFCLESFPALGSFSNESALLLRWAKYWSFSYNNRPSIEYSGLISFRIDCVFWILLIISQIY